MTGKISAPVEISRKHYAVLIEGCSSNKPVRLAVDEESILAIMPRRQPFDEVQAGSISVPIYKDTRKNKDGTRSDRYRFYIVQNGKRLPEWSRFHDKIREKATAYANQLAAIEKTAISPEGQTLAALAVEAQLEAEKIGGKFYKIVSETVGWELALRKASVGHHHHAPKTLEMLVKEELARVKNLKLVTPALVSDLAEKYIDVMDAFYDGKPELEPIRNRLIGEVKQFIKFAGTRYISEVTEGEITVWYAFRSDVTYKTAISYRSELRKFFEWARDNQFALPAGKDTAADLAAIVNAGRVVRKKRPTEAYTSDEMIAILRVFINDAELDAWVPTIALWGFCGVHFAEIERLTWGDIDFETRTVHVSDEVAGNRHHGRPIPISKANFTFFEKYGAGKDPTDPIMPDWKGEIAKKRRDAFHGAFQRYLKAANVKTKANGLRHGFASNFFVLSYNLNLTAYLMGSDPSMMYAHYLKLTTRADAVRYFCINVDLDESFGFESIEDWMPSEFRTHEEALDALRRLRTAIQLKKAKTRRSKKK